jgi:hypothetical protein
MGDINDIQNKVYVDTFNVLLFIIEAISGGLPGLEEHNRISIPAMHEYEPSWPPISPISISFFNSWASFDLRIGKDKESFTSCVIDLQKHLGIEENLCTLFKTMNDSHLGIYKVISKNNNKIGLEDLFTKRQYLCFNANHAGLVENNLCLMRLLPPLDEKFDYYIALESPYILLSSEKLWQKFLERTIGGQNKLEETEIKYRKFMKEALDPLYWLEYLFQAYAGHTDLVIYLEGLPDIKSSRPHFFDNGILPERRRY